MASVLLHIEPSLGSLQPKQLSQLVWALRQLQHTPPQVILLLFGAGLSLVPCISPAPH